MVNTMKTEKSFGPSNVFDAIATMGSLIANLSN